MIEPAAIGSLVDATPEDRLFAMQLIRAVEESLAWANRERHYVGPLHVSLGQEATPVGLCSALTPHDVLLSNHRGHGHALARGVPPERVLREILTGFGGSMHLFFREFGFLGTNGIVGDNAAIALGPAWAAQLDRHESITCVILGDGAFGTGVVYEAMNLAALWRLPILFCCENNGYAEMTPTSVHLSTSPAERAAAFGLVSSTADGTDLPDVLRAARTAAESARRNEPAFLEIRTHRFGGHYVGDPGMYRPEGEDEAWQRDFSPIDRFASTIGIPMRDVEATQTVLYEEMRRKVGDILGLG